MAAVPVLVPAVRDRRHASASASASRFNPRSPPAKLLIDHVREPPVILLRVIVEPCDEIRIEADVDLLLFAHSVNVADCYIERNTEPSCITRLQKMAS